MRGMMLLCLAGWGACDLVPTDPTGTETDADADTDTDADTDADTDTDCVGTFDGAKFDEACFATE